MKLKTVSTTQEATLGEFIYQFTTDEKGCRVKRTPVSDCALWHHSTITQNLTSEGDFKSQMICKPVYVFKNSNDAAVYVSTHFQ